MPDVWNDPDPGFVYEDVPKSDCDATVTVKLLPGVHLTGHLLDHADKSAPVIAWYPGDTADLQVDQAAFLIDQGMVVVVDGA